LNQRQEFIASGLSKPEFGIEQVTVGVKGVQ
jgi:hypothetical protein